LSFYPESAIALPCIIAKVLRAAGCNLSLSADPTAFTIAQNIRTGDRPVLCRSVNRQSEGAWLALTAWSRTLALSLGDRGPVVVAINPGSMLGSKMVRQAFGVAGGDIRIGAEILCRAALSDEFATASGRYFDNDSGRFASPHPDAIDPQKSQEIVRAIEAILAEITPE